MLVEVADGKPEKFALMGEVSEIRNGDRHYDVHARPTKKQTKTDT